MTPEDQKLTEILGRIDKLQARAEAAEAKVKVLTDALAASYKAAHDERYCQCEHPRVICDHLGCHCQNCGKMERIDLDAAARALETNNG